MSKPLVIDVGKDFSRFPGGRFSQQGPYSGQAFREQIVGPVLAHGGNVVFDLDSVVGLASSFVEEAFGGLIREVVAQGQDARALIAHISFISTKVPSYAEEIRGYMLEAMEHSTRNSVGNSPL